MQQETALASAASLPSDPAVADMSVIEQQQEQLAHIMLSESGMDEQLGSTLKSYYKLGKQDALVDQLSAIIVKKEQEIEHICNIHYRDFVSSVDRLLRVRSDATDLKSQIRDFSSEFQQSGLHVLDKVLTTFMEF